MTVRDLIRLLDRFDPNLPVAYQLYSEQCLLEPEDVAVVMLCEPREDGWVANERPDKKSVPYLLFPGN